MDGKSERHIAINFSGSSMLGVCLAASIISMGYYGRAIADRWSDAQELRAAADVEVAKHKTEQSKYNCMKWPLVQETAKPDFKVDETPKKVKVKK